MVASGFLTQMQSRVVEEYVRTGSQKAAAAALGISVQTVKNHLSHVYAQLDTGGILDTLLVLGWIAPPERPMLRICGDVAVCLLPKEHGVGHKYRSLDAR